MLIRKHGDGDWRAPDITAYDNEAAIQRILQQAPHLLPGLDGAAAVVAAELHLPTAGYVDLVAVTADGSITLVECKLRANPEIRRAVVGQMLAYAAALWGRTYDEFDAMMAARLGGSMAQHVSELAPDVDIDSFHQNVTDALRVGRFRLVIAVDQITDELKRTVLFLNQHTHTTLEVVALELGYIADAGVEILVPATYGLEVSRERKVKEGEARQQWDEAAVFEALAAVTTSEGLSLARSLYEYAQSQGATMRWGPRMASLGMDMSVRQKMTTVISLYAYPQRGVLAINFEYLRPVVTDEQMHTFVNALRAIPALATRMDGLEATGYKRRPAWPLDELAADSTAVAGIERAIDALIGRA